MQKWEYKTLLRKRSDPKLNYAWNIDIIPEIQQLGNEGWELVCISPRSNDFTSKGRTDEELWVFKRPKI